MTTLLLGLAGPQQAWGDSSRFTQRQTRPEPTKSGVLGLLASAMGRRRTDPIEDLASLSFGVRTDQPGRLERDFQTEIDWRTNKSRQLTHRYYLADARFVAAVHGPDDLLEGVVEALSSPTFPLYLGRRAFPPAGPIRGRLVDGSVLQALTSADWTASEHHRRAQGARVRLPIVRDADEGEAAAETIRDHPISYDPAHRRYEWRDVVHEFVDVDNPESTRPASRPDWLAALGGN
ncbi:type I-E CRISPR-associated protein Cas5/CasD [Gordonia spumicola]|uniref:Type I-E CRISPR-associated protein Cas5/CasD n=1 Tax=Gordonia spumicola TaxID=589161 RepID=A0A7I9VEY3_9ACTN|nr:type I-E CRISPR-associated protein Cas5/CasD [Gordonia spumicola]GEE03855.1 type I-E CRISPR-associated protein Cas5/CasD [Gordonia spumicola]